MDAKFYVTIQLGPSIPICKALQLKATVAEDSPFNHFELIDVGAMAEEWPCWVQVQAMPVPQLPMANEWVVSVFADPADGTKEINEGAEDGCFLLFKYL